MYMFPIKTISGAIFTKIWGRTKYFAPVISIRCKNFKLQGLFEGKVQQQNLSPSG